MTTLYYYFHRRIQRYFLIFVILFLTIIIKSTLSYPYHEVYQHLNFDTSSKSCPRCYCPLCKECPPTTQAKKKITTTLLDIFVYFCSTLEVLLRSFAIGFGLKLGHVLLTKPTATTTATLTTDDAIDRKSLNTCIMGGVAVMCIVFGTSLFIPTNLRTRWF